jgi:Fe-S cluster biogenesis protein NfuA
MTHENKEGSGAMKEKVQAVIDEIRPRLQADGGDIELVEVTEEGMVRVRLQGACRGCPGAAMTLSAVVENILRQRVPEVKGVERAG